MRKRRMRRPSHTTVIAYLALFVALGGGAMAAFHLGKNSVGSKQLKKNAVTAAKIKKSAVTSTKIREGAVNGATVADGSLTGADVNAASMPFSQVVDKVRGNGSLALTPTFQIYQLSNPSFTQAANEDDSFIGAVDVTFQSTCTGTRLAQALLLVDNSSLTPAPFEIAALGILTDKSGGTLSKRIQLSPYPGGISTLFQPGSPKPHTLTILITGTCEGGSGITATAAAVDVIGTTS